MAESSQSSRGLQAALRDIGTSPVWRFFTDPWVPIEDPVQLRNSRLLAAIVAIITPLAFLGMWVRRTMDPGFEALYWIEAWSLLAFSVPYVLARLGWFRTGTYLWLAFAQVLILFVMWTDTVDATRFNNPVCLVLGAALLLDLRGTTIIAVANLVTLGWVATTVEGAHSIHAWGGFTLVLFCSAIVLVTKRHRDLIEADRAGELARNEAQQRRLLEATFDGVLILGDGIVCEVNDGFCGLLGISREQILGTHFDDLLSEEERPQVGDLLACTTPQVAELVARKTDRTPITLEAVIDPLEKTPVARVLVAVRDISERKELQARLQAADRMAAIGTLAAGVAHEVNNPLTYVLSNLEEASSKIQAAATPELDEVLQRICTETLQCLSTATEGALRVQRTVQDLNTIARSDREQVATLQVKDVLDSTISIALNTLRHKGRLVTDYEEVRPVRANASRLGQVFLNLLMNACESLEDGKPSENEIRVEVQEDGDHVVVSISDTGAGISGEKIDRIFDPFFTTKPVGVGTGLGLWVCRNLLQDIGGDIRVESEEGVGTHFFIRMPATDPVVQEEAPVRPAPVDTGVRNRLLVVDDEPAIAELLGEILDHHEVHLAHSGTEALDHLRRRSFDLVLCDLMMPDLSGIQVYEASSEHVNGTPPRFVFLTGGAVTETAKRFLSETHHRVITKPFRPAMVRQVITEELSAEAVV
jgi:PAS domain S-box-containing protein